MTSITHSRMPFFATESANIDALGWDCFVEGCITYLTDRITVILASKTFLLLEATNMGQSPCLTPQSKGAGQNKALITRSCSNQIKNALSN